jgi:cyclopropane-fatty-acyl-phospholipid synthase
MVEANYFPDWLIRIGIRALLASRLDSLPRVNVEAQQAMNSQFVEELKSLPIAIQTKSANEQHYEVPTQYYEFALGKRKKYSCCIYPDASTTLD